MSLSKLSRYNDWGLLFLRVVVAAIFLYHGSQKWGLWTDAPEGMSLSMVTLFKMLSVVEPLAGLAVLLGLFTREAAAVLAVVMLGAIYTKMMIMNVGFAGQAGAGWEFDLVILAGCVILAMQGAGALSMDAKKNF
ncbi:MAG: DoxX [Candidatus Peregrinibacteria bacterium Greene0416_19]|nr:MAG: DoxX [Candidatus Peregrinibacteria bacterium Greene0416_19]